MKRFFSFLLLIVMSVVRAESLVVYKILKSDEMSVLSRDGVFYGSVHDQRDGFIHMAKKDQLERVLNKYFKGEFVHIVGYKAECFGEDLVYENSYPHLYNIPLTLEGIVENFDRQVD